MGANNRATSNGRPQLIDAPLPMFRKPRRVSVTIPESVYDYLVKRSGDEGRSLSNLAAYILEMAAEQEASLM